MPGIKNFQFAHKTINSGNPASNYTKNHTFNRCLKSIQITPETLSNGEYRQTPEHGKFTGILPISACVNDGEQNLIRYDVSETAMKQPAEKPDPW